MAQREAGPRKYHARGWGRARAKPDAAGARNVQPRGPSRVFLIPSALTDDLRAILFAHQKHVILPLLFALIAAVLAWRIWKGRPWAKFGWLQGALLLITVLIGLWWYTRTKLPYNTEGRWLNEKDMVVYDKGTEAILRFAFMVCFSTWFVSMVGSAKHTDGR
jgi:hypothetical protein